MSLKTSIVELLVISAIALTSRYTACGEPVVIEVDLAVGVEWHELQPANPGASEYATRSAVRISRALDPEKSEPYIDNSGTGLDCDLNDLQRSFHIEKTEFLVGEPVLVQLRVALDGEGSWQEFVGGNYRTRGRDDNFLFIMRRQDGSWVDDPYGPPPEVIMGGLMSADMVSKGDPQSYWQPVQRWCAIDEPGQYDLFCFHATMDLSVIGYRNAILAQLPAEVMRDHELDPRFQLIDSSTGSRSEKYSVKPKWLTHEFPPSPLLEAIPKDVLDRARQWPSRGRMMDYAHFNIVIREGLDSERRDMIGNWTESTASNDRFRRSRSRPVAAKQAICFAQQDDFLGLIEDWLAEPAAPESNDIAIYQGLATRSSSRATALLVRWPDPDAIRAMRYLQPSQIPEAIPALIDWLTDENPNVRSEGEFKLNKWTGQAFHREWSGYHGQRPTIEEAKRMHSLWADWWNENKDHFKPLPQ